MSKQQIQALNATTSGTDDVKTIADGDAAATQAAGLLGTANRNAAFNGTSWDRQRTNAAAVVSGTTQPYGALVAAPGQWVATSAPAVNTVASASKAAGAAGVRHVCQAISARLVGGTTAPAAVSVTLNLRDGATGAGAVLASWTFVLAAAVGAKDEVNLSGLNIVGSAATAMTLEFSAAGGANTFESASIAGYSTI